MKKPYRSLLILSTLTFNLSTLSWSQDQEADEDLDLFKEAVQLLEKAKLSDELNDRRILQDLEDKLPKAADVIDLAKAHAKDLQAKGFIGKEALTKAAAIIGADAKETQEENATSTGVLGPVPEKAKKMSPIEVGNDITIENTRQFVVDPDSGVFVFEEDVVMTMEKDNLHVRCDKLEVHLDDPGNDANGKGRGVKTAIATGRMVVINALNENGEPMEARCQLAIWEKDRMYLRLWPEVSMPGRLLQAQDKEAYIEAVVGEDGKIDPRIHGSIKITLKKADNS